MKRDNKHNNHKEDGYPNEYEKDLNDTFDWDWIFDREWLRTKK
jgi:hypothetical protein